MEVEFHCLEAKMSSLLSIVSFMKPMCAHCTIGIGTKTNMTQKCHSCGLHHSDAPGIRQPWATFED